MKFIFGAKPKAPITNFTRLVQLGERLGFHSAWIPDQTFFPDPFVTLAVVASHTERIELVIGVANPYTRHPVQVARAAATLDDHTPGRVALGYGAGNRRELIVPLGGEQEQAAAHCREALILCRRLLDGEFLQHRGPHFITDGVELEMAPHPAVPLYLAARGPLILQLAGERADCAVIGALLDEEALAWSLEQVANGARKSGRRLEDLGRMIWITCHITEDAPRWLDHCRPSAAHILAGAPAGVFAALRLSDRFRDELKAAYAEGGSEGAAPLVSDDLVRRLMAIGRPEEIAAQLERAIAQGIDEIGILVNAPDIRDSEEAIQRFADEVMPRLR
ncbi:MAG: LLM class flavin-dependent oxidoreductase [Chloroflexi bacterium]|nr:LLM class flavin-dependent oxidoreductase [Chloroflexota bacterium]